MNTVQKIADLIRRTASALPEDVLDALKRAARKEKKGSSAGMVLETLVKNAALAEKASTPMCQDTGTLTFFVEEGLRRKVTRTAVEKAVEIATANGWLRRNTIDSVRGNSIDTNVCPGAPVIHYIDGGSRGKGRVTLLMKGGGSENMSRQYSLPDSELGAGRDLEGVRKCVLDAVFRAQGYGCGPGIVGVCIGGDRSCGYAEAKHQLLRTLDDVSGDPMLCRLEKRILKEANLLGIGPMGLGGKTTLLGVKICALPRLPASFFVTVAYMCWAARRRTVEF